MTFARSSSGINNYRKFYGTEWIFYIEGKIALHEKTRDEIYYEQLLHLVLGHKNFKIKVVGNKNDVLIYWKSIQQNSKNNAVAIVDRDLEGISCSTVQAKQLLYTNGYSWENDFWSESLLVKIIEDMTVFNQAAINEVRSLHKHMARRLAKIAALDIGAQIHGISLIKKNNSSCGIGFNTEKFGSVSKMEFHRIANSLKSHGIDKCQIAMSVIDSAFKAPYERSIQGHLWESACLNLIGSIYKKYNKSKSAPHEIIINLGMAKLCADPSNCIPSTVLNYYKTSLGNAV